MKAVRIAEKVLNGLIDTGLIVLFIVFLLVGAYIMTDTLYIYSGASQRGALVYKPAEKGESAEKLKELSKDCVGWITVDGTNIDYPLMQGSTNAEYLNTDPFGEYSLSGSIFLDFRNQSDLSDRYSLIYGHHMEGGAMFGALDRYLDEGYYNGHQTGRITLTDGTVLEFRIFAVVSCSARDTEVFDVNEGGPSPEFLLKKAHISASYSDGRIVALTTCFGSSSDDRLAVLAEVLK